MSSAQINPATMNEREAAQYVGMSIHFLQKARSEGNVIGRTPGPPFLKIGRAVRYLRHDLDAWIMDHRVAG